MIDPPFQWQVVRARLDPIEGSEQSGVRPVLIISREGSNAVLSVVTVIPLTTRRPGRKVYPTEALIPAELGGQPNESVAMAHQIRTLSKSRLVSTYGKIDDENLRTGIRRALRVHLDLL